MNNFLSDNKTKFIAFAVVAAALSRLLPHPLNFTPIGAMALFGGTYITDKRKAFIIPLLALLISDIVLSLTTTGEFFYPGILWIYGSFALITTLGFYLRKRVQRQTVMVCSLVGSMIFFFVTNFGMWLFSGFYPVTSAGLVDCYIKAIPFFGGTIMGDLFYNLVLFGAYAIAKWKFPVMVQQQQA